MARQVSKGARQGGHVKEAEGDSISCHLQSVAIVALGREIGGVELSEALLTIGVRVRVAVDVDVNVVIVGGQQSVKNDCHKLMRDARSSDALKLN